MTTRGFAVWRRPRSQRPGPMVELTGVGGRVRAYYQCSGVKNAELQWCSEAISQGHRGYSAEVLL